METVPGSTDRRSYPRLRENSLVRYRVMDAPGPSERLSIPSVLQNISGGGVSFLSPSPVEAGKFVALDMLLPVSQSPVMALGRVVRCQPAPEESRFEVAVEFWWTGWEDESAQRAISECIRRALGARAPEASPR